jgi:hypothetical protein
MVGYFTTWVKLHNQWSLKLEMSIRQAWIRMPGCLLGSWVSPWRVLGAVFEVATAFSFVFLATKPSHVGVEVDGSGCHLHLPTTYGQQTRTQSLLTSDVLSYHTGETGEARSHLSRVWTPTD